MKWILLFLPSIAKETLSGLKENLNGLSGATKVVNKSTSVYKQPGPVESFFFIFTLIYLLMWLCWVSCNT